MRHTNHILNPNFHSLIILSNKAKVESIGKRRINKRKKRIKKKKTYNKKPKRVNNRRRRARRII